ncbi:MAG: hypothetical protein M1130_12420 [Actinobacteria bacterium]|nr:hypothetical protein [Actinomycetota bacterium]
MDSKTMTAWPRRKVLQALSSGKLKSEEVITALNIHTKVADIGPEALGFVYRRTDGTLTIVTSDALSPSDGSRS